MYTIMKKLITIALLIVNLHVSLAQEKINSSPMDVFAPFVGVWHAPDSVIKKNPHMHGRAIFKFELDEANSHLKLYEDFSLTNNTDYNFIGLLSYNPLNGMFEFMGVNTKRNFLFKGYFTNVSDNGFTREYDVTYPAGGQVAKNFGQIISFKEEFKLKDQNTLVFTILYYNKRVDFGSNGQMENIL